MSPAGITSSSTPSPNSQPGAGSAKNAGAVVTANYSKVADLAVLRTVRSAFDSFAKNTRMVWVILGACVVVATAIALLINRNEAKHQAASNAYFLAQKGLENGLKEIAKKRFPVSISSTTDVSLAAKSEAAELAASLEKVLFLKFDVNAELGPQVAALQKIARDNESTRPGFDANLTLGDLYFDHGQPALSLPFYEKAALKAPNSMDRVLALKGLSAAQEATGKYADAIATLERALQAGEGYLRGELLLSMARCYELSGETAKARAKYDEILAQLPNTESAQNAEAAKAALPQ